ncbi:MAG: DNA replication and repair protein RecF [Muribaculaceae bacterium]|nr:DNA replication and repair protein RecF [Muribaculaceae bacterium]
MILQRINLNNFKNIPAAALQFSPKINCFLGDNGMGKSNLLDAIYFLSFCKSFTGMPDTMLVRRGEEFTMAEATYLRRGTEEDITAAIAKGKRKSFKRRGKEYQRLSSHIGLLPLVMVSPRDMELINGAGEDRRRFIDMVIAQGDPTYLDQLIRYNRALQQRNTMLREATADTNLFLAVEMSMAASGAYIHKARSRQIEQLTGIFNRYYTAIAPNEDSVSLEYSSALNDGGDLAEMLDASRQRDRILHHTTVGPHRDDIAMSLAGMPVRRAASQGQAKTYTIALRMAQYEFLAQATGMKPLLLLDDIFDKLDASRVSRIMQLASSPTFGQIFITDTNRRHLDAIIADTAPGDYRLWSVHTGQFSALTPCQFDL